MNQSTSSQLDTSKSVAEFVARLSTVLVIGLNLLNPVFAGAQSTEIFIKAPVVMPDTNSAISAERTKAHHLFRALTGVLIPIDDPRLKQMEVLLKSKRMIDAEKIATSDPLFYNNRVRDLARKMSTRAESVRSPLSDFVATFVGVVRDSDTTNAKLLLTGNFTYQADPSVIASGGGTAVSMDPVKDLITSNNHYDDITKNGYSLKAVLKRVDGQQYLSNDVATAWPDPAGLITTRAFMMAHADAGTNRRLVEYAFRQFMCSPITSWADGTSPDDRIGRDVDRQPGGSTSKFLTTCKNCHSNLDGFRGAFANVDFTGNRITYSTNPVGKMNRNSDVFPDGFVTRDNSFVNYANVGKNADAFGWRGAGTGGSGIAKFGEMLANSRGFSRCMVTRIFTDVCKRAPASTEDAVVRTMADQFESSGYHLRGLFEIVAARPECGVND